METGSAAGEGANLNLPLPEGCPNEEYLVNLDLEPAAYRLRARLSDDRQVMIADRAIDLTLGVGEVRGGLGQ